MSMLSLSDSFEKSIDDLPMVEKGRVLDFLRKFMLDSTSGGLNVEAIRGASPGVFSARVSQDLRAILFRQGDTHVLLHVGHHDPAYDWARRRRICAHPITHQLQAVEVPEVAAPRVHEKSVSKQKATFDKHGDAYLLSLGVPENWLPVLRKVSTEDELLDVASKLPPDVQDALLRLAGGELVTPPAPAPKDAPLEPRAGEARRFHVVRDAAELEAVLAKPLAAWIRYLHPSQRRLVDGANNGAVKVTGSAGTGKTVVAMHRAVRLAGEGKRVLLTSYVTTLCHNIAANLSLLADEQSASRIDVQTIHKVALDTCRAAGDVVSPMNDGRLRDRIRRANQAECTPFNDDFLVTEFEQVALRSGAHTWDEYREAPRRGRGKALSVRDRKVVWSVLGRVLEDLREVGELPWSMICRAAREHLEAGRTVSPYDAVLVDELQDLDPEGIRLVAALCRDSTQLMLVGDAGQRIFAGAFTLKQLGVDVRGRSRTLRINYRTTEQIRRAADALLATECDDMDGGAQSRRARSLIAGPEPEVRGFATDAEQAAFLVGRVKTLREKGLGFAEIGVFAPFNEQRDAIAEALRAAGIPAVRLGPNDDLAGNEAVRVGTMHRAKGLEFKTVFAAHCSRGVIPAPYVSKIEDPADREAAEAQQRQLLYVVMTRARDELVMSFVGRASPLLGSEIHSVSSEAIIQPTGSTP